MGIGCVLMPRLISSLIIMLLVLVSTVMYVPVASTSYSINNYYSMASTQYRVLTNISGQKFYLFKLDLASDEAVIDTVSIFCENTLYNVAVETMNYENPMDFEKSFGKRLNYKQSFLAKYGIWYRYVEFENALIIYTSIGYMYYKYGDGKVHALHILGANFSKTLKDTIAIKLLGWLNFSVVYGGISGRGVKEITGYKGVKTKNGSVINLGTYTRKVYEEPFEKYYITIHNVRIAYPFKIGVEETANGPLLKYFEGFIPFGIVEKKMIVNDRVLQVITREYSKATGSNVEDPGELVVLDMYYAITPDNKYLAPMIFVKKNDTGRVALIALLGDKAKTLYTMTLTGQYNPSDPEINLVKVILEDARNTHNPYNVLIQPLTLTFIVIIIVPVSYIVYRSVRIRKYSR